MTRKSIVGAAVCGLLTLGALDAAAQCTKDTECKGDRICQDGVCVEPAPGVLPVPGYASPQPGYAQPQPGYHQPQPVYGPPPASGGSLFALWRTGLEIELRLGMGICVDDGDAECDSSGYVTDSELKPGIGFGAMFGVRFLPFLLVGVDFGYYTFKVELDDDLDDIVDDFRSRFLNVMLQVRGYLPFRYADVYLKVAGGYLSAKESFTVDIGENFDVESRAYAPFNAKVGVGCTFFFVQEGEYGDIGLGADFDFLFTKPLKWEYCEDDDCEDGDWDDDEGPDDADVIDSFQLSLHFTWVFTVF